MKAVLICRVSDPKQEDRYSLDSQEREGMAYANVQGMEVIKTYSFQETASKVQQRHKFDEIIGYLYSEAAKVTEPLALLAEKHDRLYRNHQSKADVERLVDSGRIEVHFFKMGKVLTRTSDPSEFLVDDVMTSVNQYQARRIGREAIKGMIEKAKQGWLPGRPPLGYVNEKVATTGKRSGRDGNESIIVPDHDARNVKLVQRIFELRAEGHSFREVGRLCVKEGIVPSELVGKLRPGFIAGLIENPFYEGRFKFNGVIYEGKHERIIPPHVIERIRELEVRDTRRKRKHNGALAGWLRCATCDCRITYDPKVKKSGRRFDYYRCANGKSAHPHLTYVAENAILDGFEPALDAIAIPDLWARQLAVALKKANDRTREAKRHQMEQFRAALKELEGAEDGLYDHLKANILDEPSYKRQIERVRSERQRFTTLLEQAQSEVDGAFLVTAEKILELSIKAKALWKTRTAQERRELLDQILSNPRLDGSTVRFDLRKPFSVLAKMREVSDWRPQPDSNRCRRLERAVS